jgi:hypothetical protein
MAAERFWSQKMGAKSFFWGLRQPPPLFSLHFYLLNTLDAEMLARAASLHPSSPASSATSQARPVTATRWKRKPQTVNEFRQVRQARVSRSAVDKRTARLRAVESV